MHRVDNDLVDWIEVIKPRKFKKSWSVTGSKGVPLLLVVFRDLGIFSCFCTMLLAISKRKR
jgi:hypothetical protein